MSPETGYGSTRSVRIGRDDLAVAASAQAHPDVVWTESLTNRTLPSANKQLTPPGWLLWAFEYDESSGPQPPHDERHEFHWYCLEFGVTIVLNKVIVVAPQPQRQPLALVRFVPD